MRLRMKQPAHKYLAKTNFRRTGAAWRQKFNVRVQVVGVITDHVHFLLHELFKQFPLLLWDGRFSADPSNLLGPKFPCVRAIAQVAEKAWQTFQEEKQRSDFRSFPRLLKCHHHHKEVVLCPLSPLAVSHLAVYFLHRQRYSRKDVRGAVYSLLR